MGGGGVEFPAAQRETQAHGKAQEKARPMVSPGRETAQQQTWVMQPDFTAPREGVALTGDVCLALFKIALVASRLPGMGHLTFLSLKRKPLSLLKTREDDKGKIQFLDFFVSEKNSRY